MNDLRFVGEDYDPLDEEVVKAKKLPCPGELFPDERTSKGRKSTCVHGKTLRCTTWRRVYGLDKIYFRRFL